VYSQGVSNVMSQDTPMKHKFVRMVTLTWKISDIGPEVIPSFPLSSLLLPERLDVLIRSIVPRWHSHFCRSLPSEELVSFLTEFCMVSTRWCQTSHQCWRHLISSLTCFGGDIDCNSFNFLILLFTSLHVSASTGHPQVKYTQSFLKAITPATDLFLRYTVLFHIMLCNI
jgi:hypothetical protein